MNNLSEERFFKYCLYLERKFYKFMERMNDKMLLFLFFMMLTITINAQDSLKIVSHSEDRFIAACNKSVCGILDTFKTPYQSFEIQTYFKTKNKVRVKLLINGKTYYSSFDKIRSNMYHFYIHTPFKNAELWIGDKKYYFYL